MTWRLAAVAVFLAAVAQQAPPRDVAAPIPTGTAIVIGTVFTGSTGSIPARKARVMLASVDGRVPGTTAATDDDGRFEFRNVPAGRYSIAVEKAGFLRGSYGVTRPNRPGMPISVADGSRTEGLTIRLVHGAAMSGTVRDARGRPVPSVIVTALRYNYALLGERRLSASREATTDDRGEYRLWGLAPGDYVIAATTTPPGGLGLWQTNDFALMTATDIDRALQGGQAPMAAPASPTPTASYTPVFFPGTTDLMLATTVTISAGDDREGLDVVVNLTRTSRIDGVVSTQDGRPESQATSERR